MIRILHFATVLAVFMAACAHSPSHQDPQGHAADPHAHHHGHAAAPALPPSGEKYEADEPLKNGMVAIRSLLDAHRHAAHEGKLSEAEATAVAEKADVEIQKIFAECKLAPAADEALHGVLAEMMEGSKMMKAGQGPEGLARIEKAHALYAELFE